MPKFLMSYRFDGDDHQQVDEFASLAEAEAAIREMALERLTYSASELCSRCSGLLIPGSPCEACAEVEDEENAP